MAILDEKRDALVIRIVYDGPPFSGKTTTLRALSDDLSCTVESPQEHDGRTLFFDWMDYTAGRFEGRPIRCQVVTVPGQKSLSARRKQLLAEADSIIFVADATSVGLDLSVKYARELGVIISKLDPPQPGVVVQANKRDLEDAIPIPELLDKLRAVNLETAITESTATTGEGVRAAFLMGVRLALDRVRDLIAKGVLATGKPNIDSSDDLLMELASDQDNRPPSVMASSSMKTPEKPPSTPGDTQASTADDRPFESTSTHLKANGNGTPIAADLLKEAIRAEQANPDDIDAARRDLPDPSVPSGFIWPPVKGRVIIQQALAGQKPTTSRLKNGDYIAHSDNGWIIHSRESDTFKSHADARAALVEWARLHVRQQHVISSRRCVVLSPHGVEWRLWQMVGRERSLKQFMEFEIAEVDAELATNYLAICCTKLLRATTVFSATRIPLPITLSTISSDSSEPTFIGLMPPYDTEFESVAHRSNGQAPAEHTLGPQIAAILSAFGSQALRSELDRIGRETRKHDAAIMYLHEVVDNREGP